MSDEEEKPPMPEVAARNQLVIDMIDQQLGETAPRMATHVPDGMARVDLFNRTNMPAEAANPHTAGRTRLEALKQRIEATELRDLCNESWRRPAGRCSPILADCSRLKWRTGLPAMHPEHNAFMSGACAVLPQVSRRYLKTTCGALAWSGWPCAHGEAKGPSCPTHAPPLTPEQRVELRDAEIEELRATLDEANTRAAAWDALAVARLKLLERANDRITGFEPLSIPWDGSDPP